MFQLQLNRIDYCQVGTTCHKCMRLLPSASNELQKVVVGDTLGVLQLFTVKQKEPTHIFKSLPGKRISRIELSGKFGEPYDRVFTAAVSEVKGYSKKGKQFYNYDTTITEPIKSMGVFGNQLYISGNYVYHVYADSKETGYYLSSDKINDLILLPVNDPSDKINPILACQNRSLRVLDGSLLLYEAEVAGPPTTLSLYNNTGGFTGREIVYGTSDGKIGVMEMNVEEPLAKWELSNEKRLAGVGCLDNYDLTNDGVEELLVGREDGVIEVYGYDSIDNPQIKFSYNGSESVTSIQGGIIGTAGYDEVVANTYTGWIFGLSTETFNKEFGNVPQTVDRESSQKIQRLKQEIEQLQGEVIQMRDTYQGTLTNPNILSTLKSFHVNDKFELSKDDASYTLSMETEVPIDNLLLQCDVPIDLLDTNKNACVVSHSECDESDGNFLLVTYRCQINTTRLDIKIRTIEGQYGLLQAYITSRLQPKNCLVKQYIIKPLSLHQRCHVIDESRPINKLKLTGSFSMAEMHSWIFYCIPELPEKMPADNEAGFYFVNTFLGTQLEISYRQGEALFKSENVSTISILKDVISKKATEKKVTLSIETEMNPDSTAYTLRCIHPMVEYHMVLAKKVHLIDGLKELSVNENDLAFLTPEYREILQNGDKYKEEYQRSPSHLERLYGMITDLYIDKFKFAGLNVKNKVPILIEKLDNYDPDELIKFFQS